MSNATTTFGGGAWSNPPPRPSTMPSMERLGTFGRFLWGLRYGPWVTAAKAALSPTALAPPWADEMPQDDFERALFRKARDLEKEGVARDQVQEWFDNERKARRERKPEPEPDPKPIPPPPFPVRVDKKDDEWPCLIDEYEKLRKICPGEAHHIMPDMTFRLGTRPELIDEMRSIAARVPNSPTFSEGMSICLTSSMHGSGPTGVHGRLRTKFQQLDGSAPQPGTATATAVRAASLQSIDEIKGLSEKCKNEAKQKVNQQLRNKNLSPNQPLRIKERPLPSGDVQNALRNGYY